MLQRGVAWDTYYLYMYARVACCRLNDCFSIWLDYNDAEIIDPWILLQHGSMDDHWEIMFLLLCLIILFFLNIAFVMILSFFR